MTTLDGYTAVIARSIADTRAQVQQPSVWDPECADAVTLTACNLADALAQADPGFDTQTFLDACGITPIDYHRVR